MNDKLCFLLNLAKIYDKLIEQTESNCLKHFLAFKVIVVAMSFEDLVNTRNHQQARSIRNVFLAHQQNGDFFDAFNSLEQISKTTVLSLITEMEAHLGSTYAPVVELTDLELATNINALSKKILNKFDEEFYSGFRISNNFLCTGDRQIKEISSNSISSVFYRYNSSKELSIFANFFITNFVSSNLSQLMLNSFKIDYILHAVNMRDSIFKDYSNKYSIDGLYEVIKLNDMGDIVHLNNLLANSNMTNIYNELKWLRNKLSGHMDKKEPLSNLIVKLEAFNFEKAFYFVNELDKAVWKTSLNNISLRINYSSNQKIEDENIISINGFKNEPYDS